jgi:glycine cleavage system aminomethyltransferase T
MWSPVLKEYIALARVRPAYAAVGSRVAMEVTVEAERKQAEAVVVKTPFYDPARKKA